MRIECIDPADERRFRAWFDVLDICHRLDWPDQPGWQFAELRARALDAGATVRFEHLAAVDADGHTVGAASLELPQRDNTDSVNVVINVRPAYRGRGAGSELLAAVERRARALGRSVARVRLEEPAAQAGHSAGRAFAIRRHYDCAQVMVRRDLRFPLDESRLAALEAACAPHATDYRLTSWRDRCPDEFLADRAELARQMSTDAPRGGLTNQEQVWDEARIRDQEAVAARQNRTFLVTGALHEPTGRLVAFTDIGVPLAATGKVIQRFTMVLREHRGHRLGTLIKIVNHRSLAITFPEVTVLDALNAADNRVMIAVNESLGYLPVGTISTWQKRLPPA